jgi:hypothetical protein
MHSSSFTYLSSMLSNVPLIRVTCVRNSDCCVANTVRSPYNTATCCASLARAALIINMLWIQYNCIILTTRSDLCQDSGNIPDSGITLAGMRPTKRLGTTSIQWCTCAYNIISQIVPSGIILREK